MTDEAKALVEECRLDAKAFRENTVYDSDGDPIRLIANAERLDQYADRIEALEAENERMREALEQFLSLIEYQYCGSREAMNALQEADNSARAALAGDIHDQ